MLSSTSHSSAGVADALRHSSAPGAPAARSSYADQTANVPRATPRSRSGAAGLSNSFVASNDDIINDNNSSSGSRSSRFQRTDIFGVHAEQQQQLQHHNQQHHNHNQQQQLQQQQLQQPQQQQPQQPQQIRADRNHSTIFDVDPPMAAAAPNTRGGPRRSGSSVGDLFGSYAPSAPSAARRRSPASTAATPTKAPLVAETFRHAGTSDNLHDDVDAISERIARLNADEAAPLADAPRSPGLSNASAPSSASASARFAYGQPHNHYNSSIFNTPEDNPVRTSRRHYGLGQFASDIFNQGSDSGSSPVSRGTPRSQGSRSDLFYSQQQQDPSHKLPLQQQQPFEPLWSPKRDYTKSTSFSNIFGDIPANQAAPASERDLRGNPAARIEFMNRAGGLSSSDLHRGTRGKGRQISGSQVAGSQIWF